MQSLGAATERNGSIMANFNKVMLIGRLTRDPEVKHLSNGGCLAKFGFAVNNRRKNQQTGAYEDEPVFLDVETWDRERNQCATNAAKHLRKGSQAFIDGHLKFESWTSQDGTKRSALRVVADSIQYLDPKSAGDPRGEFCEDPDDVNALSRGGSGKSTSKYDEPIPF